MFGRFPRDFDDDPFFSGFGHHHRDMFESMGRFQDPLLALSDGKSDRRNGRENSDRRVADPFSGFFQSMNSMMADMQRRVADFESSDDPNVHSFTSSNVMTYVNDGKSEPKYFQASKSTRRAPGNVKETRRTLRDSQTGIDKMAVGHHIGSKGRVIERKRNNKAGGAIEEEKNYFHMGEEDEQDFENEWRKRTTSYNLDYGKPARSHGIGAPAHGIGAPRQPQTTSTKQPKQRLVKTPAVAVQGSNIELSRPHGPSKSGRNRSKY